MLRRIGRVLYAIYSPIFVGLFGLNTFCFALACLASVLVSGRGHAAHRIGQVWSRFNLVLAGVRVTTRGIDHIAPGQTYVAVANHQSLYDVWAAIGWLPLQLRFVIKHSYRRLPLIGWILERMGHLFVDRTSADSAASTVERAIARLGSGTSVFFFPEGTRSPDGRLIEFKSGGFRVAQAVRAPILPLTINGGRRLCRKGSLQLLPGRMEIVVHPPLAIAEGDERVARLQLMQQARQSIASALRVD